MRLLIITLSILFTIGTHPVCNAETIILAADEWCPINCKPDSSEPGAFIEIAQKSFKNKGHTIKYVVMPWARAIHAARFGEIEGIIGAYKNDAPDFIFPKNEQMVISNSFFVRKESNWNYNGIESLSKVVLGAVKDYDYTDPALDEYIDTGDNVQFVYGISPLEINIKKLIAGRVDAIVAATPVLWYLAHKLQVNDHLREAGQVTKAAEAYIAFSPINPSSEEYAKILSDGMDTLRQSGELKSILAKYGLQDWK